MPELQLDVQVANRFISSLSKSLQALCHGCMDFDSGIEIVGYINVNIDSGSKVDYVLNEKVLKSTTNSMTFVSNSFLAKKDQPKQTRDGSCSPVHELEEQYQAAFRGASMGMHHRRSTSHLPPQSHSFRGSSKRSWSGDFRMAAKRHRLQHPQSESQSFSGHSPQFPQPTFPSPSTSQVYTDSSFKHPQPSNATELSSDSQQQISIKKEALDTDDNKLTSNPDTDSSTDQNQPPDESHNSTKEQTDNFKIKQDPDAAATTDDQETASENTDIKNTLQDQSSSADSQQPEEGHTDIKSTNEEVPDNQLPTFGEGQNVAAEHDGASTSADMSFPSEGGAFDSDIPIEYDNAAEDGSYSQSTYPDDSVDPGEGSSDANQFEVIEIDDEDEDVQAMFGEPRLQPSKKKTSKRPPLTNAEKCKAYRERLKNDVTKYMLFVEKRNEANRCYRQNLTPDKKEVFREKARIRQQKFRQKLKNDMAVKKKTPMRNRKNSQQTPKHTTKQAHLDAYKREQNRLRQQKRRANMSPHKKWQELERKRARYHNQKEERHIIIKGESNIY